MIDIESQVFTKISDAVKAEFPKVYMKSVHVLTTSEFPCVIVEEADNYVRQNTISSGETENYANVMYEINIYSNRPNTAKSEAKAIAAIVDETMQNMGFIRQTTNPVNTRDVTQFRLFMRYIATVDKNEQIFRR